MTVTISGYGRRFQLVGVLLVVAALAVAFFARPASAAIAATVTPTTNLGDTGTLSITASGFATQLNTVFVIECVHGATSSDQCDANTEDGSLSADANGNYTNPAYTYYELPNAVFGGVDSITCDLNNPCDLVIIQDDYNNFSNPHVNIPLSFSSVASTTAAVTEPPTVAPTTAVPTTATPSTFATATTTHTGTTPPPKTTGDATTTTDASAGATGETTTTSAGTTHAGSTTTRDATTTSGATTTTEACAGTTIAGQGTGATLGSDPGDVSGGSSGSGGTLPFTGPPTAAPIIAICGLVILLAGTVMRRIVLNVPDAGVPLS